MGWKEERVCGNWFSLYNRDAFYCFISQIISVIKLPWQQGATRWWSSPVRSQQGCHPAGNILILKTDKQLVLLHHLTSCEKAKNNRSFWSTVSIFYFLKTCFEASWKAPDLLTLWGDDLVAWLIFGQLEKINAHLSISVIFLLSFNACWTSLLFFS